MNSPRRASGFLCSHSRHFLATTNLGSYLVAHLLILNPVKQTINLTAPSTAGTYYYGACVDAVTDESDTTNNCSSSVQVTVPEPVATTARTWR